MHLNGVKGTGAQGIIGVRLCTRGEERILRMELIVCDLLDKHSESKRQHLPDAAAVYCLKGKLWHAHDDAKKAVECYVEALKLNPFMWDAFLGLCDTGEPVFRKRAEDDLTSLGANIRIPNIFKMTPEMLAVLAASPNTELPHLGVLDESPPANGPLQAQPNNIVPNHPLPTNDPFSVSTNRLNVDGSMNSSVSGLLGKMSVGTVNTTPAGIGGVQPFTTMDTPTGTSGRDDPNNMMGGGVSSAAPSSIITEPPLAPLRKARTLQGLGMDFSIDAAPTMRPRPFKTQNKSRTESDEVESTASSKPSTVVPSIYDRKRTVSGQAAQAIPSTSNAHANTHVNDPTAPQRRSVRLFNQIRPTASKFSTSTGSTSVRDGKELKKAKATGAKGRSINSSAVGRVVSGNRKPVDGMDIDMKESRPASVASSGPSLGNPKPAVNEKVKEYEGLQWLLDLFTRLGSGYFALTHYQCQDALQIFNGIPQAQRETPWVLAQIGRAHYEQAAYAEAEKYFVRIRSLAPSRLEDMEVYSTVLWHMKNPVELAFLAHELVEIDRLSPQAWCAIGNSFSLQRDHDQALKCFKRAVQLDPKFAYAFTLQGHEHVANEEYDKALVSYRSAIAAENRHYNAWYGLGKVYEKMGKYDVAEQHYRTAAGINPTNAVLVCCIGMALEKLKSPKAALLQYTRACELAPKSALSRFKKARVLMTLQEPNLALVELKILKDIAPDEANVHFLLGRLYKMLHQKGNAIKHFTTALNLDPKVCSWC